MDDPGPNWGQIAITGRRRASDEFGRSCSDPNLVPGRAFFGHYQRADPVFTLEWRILNLHFMSGLAIN